MAYGRVVLFALQEECMHARREKAKGERDFIFERKTNGKRNNGSILNHILYICTSTVL